MSLKGLSRPDFRKSLLAGILMDLPPPTDAPQQPARGILATRNGRLLSFFLLYVTEGIPLGFTAVALAALMREQGMGTAEIGTFVATLYLPWSWKWIVGPVVDTVYSTRLGKRRAWIVGCQTMMALTLLLGMQVDFSNLASKTMNWFTLLILVHNVFAATMDVAIDALAVSTVPSNERGAANGLMFAGAYLGNALGGSGILFLLPYIPLSVSFLVVVASILLVVALVSVRLMESDVETVQVSNTDDLPTTGGGTGFIRYLLIVWKSCFCSRNAIAGLCFALLPVGAYGLGLALQSNLAVELGFDKSSIAWLNLASTVVAAAGCVLGGHLSDRLGRRRMLGMYALLTTIPTIWLAYQLHQFGWIMPVKISEGSSTTVPRELVLSLWVAAVAYNFVHGLMYGTRTAMFMDLCQSEVAATQFTAYMSLMNLAISYSAFWQGHSAERWGYPTTLFLDALLGCLCIIPLACMSSPGMSSSSPETRA